jgi:hypothetical protein
MASALAIFLSLFLLSLVFIGAGWGMVCRVTPEHRRKQTLRWLLPWSLKGLVLPAMIWTLMNIGLAWNLQPFMPQIQAAKNAAGDWVAELLSVLGVGFFVVSSYWAAITLGWVLFQAGRSLTGEPRSDFKALGWTCLVGLCLPAAGILYLGGWPVLGLAATTILGPAAAYAPAILRTKKLPPMYGRAVAKLKFGKYSEAEWEIIHELENCEDDFDGWMMLADLYANQFRDVAEAEQTVLEICDQPKTTAPQLSVALHRLADWHLKLAGDPDAARRALQMICDRVPRSHLAHMAQLRINQLPSSAEELREQRSSRPIPLPALGDSFDEAPGEPESAIDRSKAAALANSCVEKLTLDPNNIAAREKLARIFAERLDQAQLGIEQLMLLLNMPDQEDAKRAEWLGLTAAWHIKYREDLAAGRKILERLVREFPQSAQAFSARRRLQSLDV